MTHCGLGELLADAVCEAEHDAPSVDPLAALSGVRQRRRDRRGYLAVLAFVVFALLVQADPRAAHGGTEPSVLSAAPTVAASSAGHG